MAAKLLKALSYEQAQRFCNAPVGLAQHAFDPACRRFYALPLVSAQHLRLSTKALRC